MNHYELVRDVDGALRWVPVDSGSEFYELERCEACGLFVSGNVPEGLRWRVCHCRLDLL